MFGYVRPFKPELRVRDFEGFRAVYCGLCHSLKDNCGFSARFLVNYDFTFMAMLLWTGESVCTQHKRCVASPFKKKCIVQNEQSLVTSANYSVILYYWKLIDSVEDEGFFKSIAPRIAVLFLKRSYKKSSAAEPVFDALCRENLQRLGELENAQSPSLDACADSFALILAAAAENFDDELSQRSLRQIFYHVGRVIYILDAVDDLERDFKNKSFNPLIYRFSLEGYELSQDDKEYLKSTIEHSLSLAASAFELLPPRAWTDVISNILYQGIPWVSDRVFSGQWQEIGRKRNKINDRTI